MDAEGGLVAVALHAPGEDANLVEVEWQTGFWRAECGYVFGNLVMGRVGLGVGDMGEYIGSNDSLAFRILPYFVGHVDIHTPPNQPPESALGIAN